MRNPEEKIQSMFSGAVLTRRQLVKAGGALLVGFGVAGSGARSKPVKAARSRNTLDATLPEFVD